CPDADRVLYCLRCLADAGVGAAPVASWRVEYEWCRSRSRIREGHSLLTVHRNLQRDGPAGDLSAALPGRRRVAVERAAGGPAAWRGNAASAGNATRGGAAVGRSSGIRRVTGRD